MKEMKEEKYFSPLPLWQLSVSQFVEIQKEVLSEILKENENKNRYVYGLKGLAKILGCSKATASKVKSSGILDEAIYQNGKTIIIDKVRALELFSKNKKK